MFAGLFASLFRHIERTASQETELLVEMLGELVTLMFRAEDLRNSILHSTWEAAIFVDRPTERSKRSAKAKKGLVDRREHMDPAALLDVAEFIEYATNMTQEFSIRCRTLHLNTGCLTGSSG